MPTAQTSSTLTQNKNNTKQVDNKIAKAVAKVEQTKTSNSNQESATIASGGASTTGNKTPQEQPEFIKQSLIIVEKKVRNLEKRRAKLDEYKESQKKGTVLNEDQLSAVNKYDEVIRSLELARELEKQFVTLANDTLKQQKKQAKKEQQEREESIKEKLKEAHKINSLMTTFGEESIRNDFLNELNGATKISQQELTLLDEFNKLIQVSDLGNKLEAASTESAEHFLNLIEGKNKQITSLNQDITGPVTYSDLKKLFERIYSSPYWTQEQQQTQSQTELATETQPDQDQQEHLQQDLHHQQQQQQQQQQENLNEQMNNINLNTNQNLNDAKKLDQVQIDQQQQAVYHQQNTSDDFVLVNSNDFNENTQSKFQQSPNQQQQHPQSKAFFTTLNPTSNINEFLQNNDEGINFLQDSEIQLRQQQEQVQQQPSDNFQIPQQHAQLVQQQQPQQQNNFQEFNQNEGHRENRGGHRGGHYNGNRNFDQRKNYDQRRSGGGNYQPRGDNNGPRNGGGSGGYRGGNRGSFRGGYSNSGPRTGSGGNQYPRQPRNQQESSHHHQQSVPQN